MKTIMIFLLAFGLFSCGQDKKKEEVRLSDYNHSDAQKSAEEMEAGGKETTAAAVEESVAEANVVEVSLEGTDQMTFNKDEIKVPAGSIIKLTLTHVGKLPANVMGHNFVLLRNGTDIPAFGMKATEFADNNYIPKGTNAVIAHTKIVGGGESDTIEFKAPKPGTYTFICSFPGHYMVMKGVFIVE